MKLYGTTGRVNPNLKPVELVPEEPVAHDVPESEDDISESSGERRQTSLTEFNGEHMMMLSLIAIIPAMAVLVVPLLLKRTFQKVEEIPVEKPLTH